MKEIKIINELPIILTKDRAWFREADKDKKKMRPGSAYLLPEDAIVVIPPLIQGIKVRVPKKL